MISSEEQETGENTERKDRSKLHEVPVVREREIWETKRKANKSQLIKC